MLSLLLVPVLVASTPAFAVTCQGGYQYEGEQETQYLHSGVLAAMTFANTTMTDPHQYHVINNLQLEDNDECNSLGDGGICSFSAGFGMGSFSEGNTNYYLPINAGYIERIDEGPYTVLPEPVADVSPWFLSQVYATGQEWGCCNSYIFQLVAVVYTSPSTDAVIYGAFPSPSDYEAAANQEMTMSSSGPCVSNPGTYYGAATGGYVNQNTVLQASTSYPVSFHNIFNWQTVNWYNEYQVNQLPGQGDTAFSVSGG